LARLYRDLRGQDMIEYALMAAFIAVASAATSMKAQDEGRLFRFTLRHSILLASVTGLIVVFYVYVAPQWAP
jgi:L-lactate permease